MILALLVGGCTAVSTSFDYDPEADFTQLETYAWVPVEHDASVSELVLNRIENAVHDQLGAAGYRAVAASESDFTIQAHVSRRQKTQVTESPGGHDDIGWAGYHIDVHSYEEGTLVLDVEGATGKLLWRGVARRAIDSSWTPEQITERVREAVGLVLVRFPPGADDQEAP